MAAGKPPPRRPAGHQARRGDGRQGYKTLREYLVAEVAERPGRRGRQLQFHFNPADQKLLNLGEPQFQFNLTPPRRKALGEVTWGVAVIADGQSQKAIVTAMVRAWQNQSWSTSRWAMAEVIRDGDVVDRRTLVDQLATTRSSPATKSSGRWPAASSRAARS